MANKNPIHEALRRIRELEIKVSKLQKRVTHLEEEIALNANLKIDELDDVKVCEKNK